jgi:hypothetical protein
LIEALREILFISINILLKRANFRYKKEDIHLIINELPIASFIAIFPFIVFDLFNSIEEYTVIPSIIVFIVFMINMIFYDFLFKSGKLKLSEVIMDTIKLFVILIPYFLVESVLYLVFHNISQKMAWFAVLFVISFNFFLWYGMIYFYKSTYWKGIDDFVKRLPLFYYKTFELNIYMDFSLYSITAFFFIVKSTIFRIISLVFFFFFLYYFLGIKSINDKNFFNKFFKSSILTTAFMLVIIGIFYLLE